MVRHAAAGLSAPQIARVMIVSIPTVKTHLRNAYAKLGVNDRASAVRELIHLGVMTAEPPERAQAAADARAQRFSIAV